MPESPATLKKRKEDQPKNLVRLFNIYAIQGLSAEKAIRLFKDWKKGKVVWFK